ncbi:MULTISPECIES: Crp/Fnr family transcriptional regulator [unclassified Lysobacter]|uniref:Crp/Fnr family transcriptional regulator n=1 Tax=unclassified Lysobacter TaxID=2635362 RepID=UPI001BE53212|nr:MULTISPECIES: Crp/Fnr family transcriptional regulator [unclassified Lysobacter]MBT2748724.1 Crp/Fnr family transcriptional regulator [Lysobacter sp. ISL-42]MBT2751659.1 Crp/Fnr family transcriptional regulator [Lysobacter sp. ISL-50]MBT2775853.1 Crp/Fnr family transcriptional regulator [Lysobacter sp. ISL-54]MBT2782183.1 Crp/Fnr family transcriptional regulator [Lysobacter sp. ISL-52]
MVQQANDPWFKSLPEECRRTLLQEGVEIQLQPGELVMRRGEPPKGFYGLVDGLAKARTLRADGRESVLAVVEPGHWFSQVSLFDGGPSMHDVVALTKTVVRRVDVPTFNRLLTNYDFAMAILRLMATHSRGVYAYMEDAGLRSTKARIARRLQRLSRGDVELDSPMEKRTIEVTHDLLAAMLGLTRQTVSLELRQLEALGVIEIGYRNITIVSMENLRAIGKES